MKVSSFFHRYKEILLGVVMVCFSLFYLYESTFIRVRSTVSVSAKLIPEVLGVIVLFLGILQMVAGAKHLANMLVLDHIEKNKAEFMSPQEKRDIVPVVLTFILIAAYAIAYEPVGFIISSILCMFFQMMILTPKSQKRPALFFLISVVVAILVYIAFRRGLDLSLPQGILEGVLPF